MTRPVEYDAPRSPRVGGVLEMLAGAAIRVACRAGRWLFWQLRVSFARLSVLGKVLALAGACFLLAAVADQLGVRRVAASLDHLGLVLISLAATVAVVLHLWTRFTDPPRHGGWTRR